MLAPTPLSGALLLAIGLCTLAEDVVERFVAPMARSEFQASIHEQRWAYFPHNESLVPITLDHVSEWFAAGTGAAPEEALEVLSHPVTRRAYDAGGRRQRPLELLQDAFLQGFSAVVNSLQRWSEPGARLARELFASADLPVDVYMYLTPPHSKSYDMHCDVMDAWMVQINGSKTWKLCEERNFAKEVRDEEQPGGRCEEVTMQGGDVLYVPFATLHEAATSHQLSAHLTVNVERQHYVWATLLVAVLHKAADPRLTVERFLESGAFRMEGEADIELLFLGLMHKIPRLARMPACESEPLFASRYLTRALSNEDLPTNYLQKVREEYRDLVAAVIRGVSSSKKLRHLTVSLRGQEVPAEQVAQLLEQQDPAAAVSWALELARLHAVRHFAKDNGERLLSPPEIFSSLAALGSVAGLGVQASEGGTVRGIKRLLAPWTLLERRPEVRVVLLLQDRPPSGPVALQLGGATLPLRGEHVSLVQYCLGLFAEGAARGRAFSAGAVPGGFSAAVPVFAQLVARGVLRVLPAPPPAQPA